MYTYTYTHTFFSTQSRIQWIKFNSISNSHLSTEIDKSDSKIYMEIQRTQNSQTIFEKQQSYRTNATWLQELTKSYSNQEGGTKIQTNKWNKTESRNRPTIIGPNDFQ